MSDLCVLEVAWAYMISLSEYSVMSLKDQCYNSQKSFFVVVLFPSFYVQVGHKLQTYKANQDLVYKFILRESIRPLKHRPDINKLTV